MFFCVEFDLPIGQGQLGGAGNHCSNVTLLCLPTPDLHVVAVLESPPASHHLNVAAEICDHNPACSCCT